MSEHAENLIQYPRAFRDLHENILAEIKQNSEGASSSQMIYEPGLQAQVTDDLAPYLSCIENASRAVEASAARVQQLEAWILDLQTEQEEANRARAELEKALDTERTQCMRAESLAAAATSRASNLETALADATEKLGTLKMAIYESFANVTGTRNSAAEAA
jgi:chromosome segregation ATPase